MLLNLAINWRLKINDWDWVDSYHDMKNVFPSVKHDELENDIVCFAPTEQQSSLSQRHVNQHVRLNCADGP